MKSIRHLNCELIFLNPVSPWITVVVNPFYNNIIEVILSKFFWQCCITQQCSSYAHPTMLIQDSSSVFISRLIKFTIISLNTPVSAKCTWQMKLFFSALIGDTMKANIARSDVSYSSDKLPYLNIRVWSSSTPLTISFLNILTSRVKYVASKVNMQSPSSFASS